MRIFRARPPTSLARLPGPLLLACCLGSLLILAAPAWVEEPSNGDELNFAPNGPAGSKLRIEVKDGTVTLEARDAPLVEVLYRLSEELSFRVQVIGRVDELITRSLSERSLDTVLRDLLDRWSYVVIYGGTSAGSGSRPATQLLVYGHITDDDAADPESPAQLALRARQARELRARLEIVEALGREQASQAIWDLAEYLTADPDTPIRHAAATALGAYGDRESVDALRLALNDSSHWVRKAALRALARIGDLRSLEAVKLTVETDHDAEVRDLAARVVDVLEHKLRK